MSGYVGCSLPFPPCLCMSASLWAVGLLLRRGGSISIYLCLAGRVAMPPGM